MFLFSTLKHFIHTVLHQTFQHIGFNFKLWWLKQEEIFLNHFCSWPPDKSTMKSKIVKVNLWLVSLSMYIIFKYAALVLTFQMIVCVTLTTIPLVLAFMVVFAVSAMSCLFTNVYNKIFLLVLTGIASLFPGSGWQATALNAMSFLLLQ